MSRLSRTVQRFLIAMFVLALVGGAIVVMTFAAIPEANRDAIIQLIGGVTTLAGMVIGFYFSRPHAGSSAEDEQ